MEVKDLIRLTKYYLLKPLGYKDYVPFIVLSRSRTGSNFLNSSLRSHPNVRVKGEHFGHLGGDSIEKRYGDVFGKQPRYIKAAGCKVFYYHPHHGDATELFSLLQKNRNLRGRVDLCCTYFDQQCIGSHININASDTMLA